jgi:hypothetical protein
LGALVLISALTLHEDKTWAVIFFLWGPVFLVGLILQSLQIVTVVLSGDTLFLKSALITQQVKLWNITSVVRKKFVRKGATREFIEVRAGNQKYLIPFGVDSSGDLFRQLQLAVPSHTQDLTYDSISEIKRWLPFFIAISVQLSALPLLPWGSKVDLNVMSAIRFSAPGLLCVLPCLWLYRRRGQVQSSSIVIATVNAVILLLVLIDQYWP